MPRTARIVVPGVPHHITQRGNRRMRTFMCEEDFARYRSVMSESCARSGVEIWAYCLMPNHAHMIAVPESEAALRCAIGDAHQKYTREINKRERWRGHLWQGRFASYPMDDAHTLSAARYIELNPVRAGLVSSAAEYEWSSARAHLFGQDDELVVVAPLLARRRDWARFVNETIDANMLDALRRHIASGMPLGDEVFLREIERRVGSIIPPRAA